MTDNEIIKALENEVKSTEYVDSEDCNGVDLTLIKSAIDLINRQKAEVERLKECPKCIYEYDGNTTEYCIQEPCSNFKTTEQVRAEAYKEFAEHLKEMWSNNYYDSPDVDFDEFVDNLLKEYEKGR